MILIWVDFLSHVLPSVNFLFLFWVEDSAIFLRKHRSKFGPQLRHLEFLFLRVSDWFNGLAKIIGWEDTMVGWFRNPTQPLTSGVKNPVKNGMNYLSLNCFFSRISNEPSTVLYVRTWWVKKSWKLWTWDCLLTDGVGQQRLLQETPPKKGSSIAMSWPREWCGCELQKKQHMWWSCLFSVKLWCFCQDIYQFKKRM